MIFKLLQAYLFFSLLWVGICTQTYQGPPSRMEKVKRLPSEIKESSGLALAGKDAFWTHNDSGNKPRLYKIAKTGEYLETVKFNNITNVDWEDLTEDDNGYLYIGDFGNGNNDRKDLVIYKVLKTDLKPNTKNIPVEKIFFTYPDQTKFPPNKKNRGYDVESMFYKNSHLYLLTKDQSSPSIDSSRLYRLPSKSGVYKAEYITSIKTKLKKNRGQVTSAALSPNGKILAITTNENLWIYREVKRKKFFKGTKERMNLIKGLQVEAVVFTDECTLYLTCEKNNRQNASLYKFDLCGK